MIRFEMRLGKDGMGVLQVRVVGNGVNSKVSTGVKIKAKEWVAEAQALKHPGDERKVASLMGQSYAQLNAQLTELRRELDVIDKRGEATMEAVKRLVVEILKEKRCERTVDVRKGCFVRFVEQYINEMKDGSRTNAKTHEKIREYYPKQYNALLVMLRRYEEEKGVDIGWGSLTKTFFERFCVYLSEKGKKRNTITLYAQKLSRIVKEAEKQRLVTCETDVKEWKVQPELTDQVVLSEEKLDELFAVDMTDFRDMYRLIGRQSGEEREWVKNRLKTATRRQKMQEVVNIFLVCCFTGQRFSDYRKITKDSICRLSDGREYIRLKQQKTGKDLYVPVDPRLKTVLDRTMWTKSIEQMNRGIKDVGRVMGWTELTGFTKERNGMKYKSQTPFYQYMKSHTARRTFATLAYKRGASLEAIMAVTGHTTEESLRRYIRVEAEEKAMMASKELFRMQECTKIVAG